MSIRARIDSRADDGAVAWGAEVDLRRGRRRRGARTGGSRRGTRDGGSLRKRDPGRGEQHAGHDQEAGAGERVRGDEPGDMHVR